MLLHFVRGGHPAGPNRTDCTPGHSNWQVTSPDGGLTWTAPQDLSAFLGPYVGSLPGPGNGGVQLRGSGRLVFNAHFGTAERGSGAVIVYYSDDGGKTYTMANTTAGGHGHPFKHMDESTMTEAEDGGVVINMRNDPYVPNIKYLQ